VIARTFVFLGERIAADPRGDLYADLDRHAQEGALDRFRSSWAGASRCATEASTPAVLDIFDYLEPAAASVLAGEVKRMLRRSVLLGFFGARASDDTRYTKYFIEDEDASSPSLLPLRVHRRWVLQNRTSTTSRRPRALRFPPAEIGRPGDSLPEANPGLIGDGLQLRPASLRPCSSTPNDRGVLGMRNR